jgi:putative sterol carrier protein
MTPNELFAQLPEHLDPNTAKGLNATVQFNLSGEDGGRWWVAVHDGRAETGAGSVPNANVTIAMDARDYVDMVVGDLNHQVAFMSGRLQISGDMELAMKLRTLFRRPIA